ncbi:hypothetical protein C3L33_15846, partial [Rhododendron williamsianum]
MAQSNSNAKNSTDELNPTVFHDFLGRSCASDSSPAAVKPAASPAALPLLGPFLLLLIWVLVSDHFEGVPFYGPRSDLTGTEISNRFAGNKRSNSDSVFLGSSRDGLPHVGPDSLDGLHLMKYPPRAGQVAPFGCQVPSNRFKDANAGPSVISQAAADEGSRTGIKGSGILSSINARSVVSDRSPSEMLLTGTKQKSGIHNSEPESSTPSSRHGLSSACRQMTIFYGGQAHVFDDVHPNKDWELEQVEALVTLFYDLTGLEIREILHEADVIMALAGSNGGSWSTTYLPKSAAAPGESYVPGGENETGMASNFASPHEFRRRLSNMSTSSHGFGTGDQISGPLASGIRQGNGLMKDEKVSVQAAESRIEEKREA